MVKKLASKTTKELFTDAEIREKGLNKSEFTGTWQGRLCIIDSKKSMIARRIGVDKQGEYAIKVR